VLVFRILAAIAITLIVIAGRSDKAARFVMLAGPAIVVVTMLLFAIALQRVASAGIDGMPRLLFALGAALTVWWGAIQLAQVSVLLGATRDVYRAEHALSVLQRFSIAGPIVVTLGLALVGSAIASFASRRGDAGLRGVAAGRTFTFVAATLLGIGIQSQLAGARSLDTALAMIVLAAILSIAGLAALVGLLGRAADAIEAEPGVPPARVV
jgi:hypothetical protein